MATDVSTTRLKLTDHAIDRFHKRWAPDLTREAAAEVLNEHLANATPLRVRTMKKGHEVWAADEVRFVVKRDAGVNDPVVVTVLPKINEARHESADNIYAEWLEEQRDRVSQSSDNARQFELAKIELELAVRDQREAEALSSSAKEWLAEVNRRIVSAKERINWLKKRGVQVHR